MNQGGLGAMGAGGPMMGGLNPMMMAGMPGMSAESMNMFAQVPRRARPAQCDSASCKAALAWLRATERCGTARRRVC